MICAINYANDKYRPAQVFNTKRALRYGADKVIEYSRESLPEDFVESNKVVLQNKRGDGYWLWKPFIILDALKRIEYGDYLVYSDSGSAFVNSIDNLIEAMNREKTDIMAFCIDQIERKWSKRDALVLLDCDSSKYLDSLQICATYIILKKTAVSVNIIEQYMDSSKDERIITDNPNVMGLDNYPEFIENRHDQTVWSLVCKKNGINPFRDPSEFGNDLSQFPAEVLKRSTYGQVIESHRNPDIKYDFELKYEAKWWMLILRLARICLIRVKKNMQRHE